MENLLIILIGLTILGFSFVNFIVFQLLKERRLTNENLSSINKSLVDVSSFLNKLEALEKEHKSVSQLGFSQIVTALKETIKLE